jgi:hypothetical protein
MCLLDSNAACPANNLVRVQRSTHSITLAYFKAAATNELQVNRLMSPAIFPSAGHRLRFLTQPRLALPMSTTRIETLRSTSVAPVHVRPVLI